MEDTKLLEQIVRRLDVLIALEIEKPLHEKQTTITQRIVRLEALGLPSAEIAGLVGKGTNYVNAVLSQKRKAAKKKD